MVVDNGASDNLNSPRLIAVSGPPCGGKSAIARRLTEDAGMHWLQVDRILSVLLPKSDRNRADRDVAYMAMILMASELLKCGRTVLLDATFSRAEQRRAVENCAVAHRAPLYLIQCRISPQAAAVRFTRRTDHPATDLSEERVRRLASTFRYVDAGLCLMEVDVAAGVIAARSYLAEGKPIPVDGFWSAAASGFISG